MSAQTLLEELKRLGARAEADGEWLGYRSPGEAGYGPQEG